jgi:hypothetical protein
MLSNAGHPTQIAQATVVAQLGGIFLAIGMATVDIVEAIKGSRRARARRRREGLLMCGRFVRTAKAEDIADLFQLTEVPAVEPRYNAAPSQEVLAVRQTPEHRDRQLVALRWGLIPHWADDPKIGYRMINAGAETAAEKPAFRSAFRARRCLVAARRFHQGPAARVSSEEQLESSLRPRGRPKKNGKAWKRNLTPSFPSRKDRR